MFTRYTKTDQILYQVEVNDFRNIIRAIRKKFIKLILIKLMMIILCTNVYYHSNINYRFMVLWINV